MSKMSELHADIEELREEGFDNVQIAKMLCIPLGMIPEQEEDSVDDGQPTEYEEWQDYMGGDDWDQGQYDEAY